MKKHSNLLVLILTLFLLSIIPAKAVSSEDYRNVDTSLKVYDYADLFTDNEESYLKNRILDLIESHDYDIFIVTIDYNDISYSTTDKSMSFIEDFGDYNGFGIQHGNDLDLGMDYVALLIDEDNETIWMDVKGTKCMGIYSDSIQNKILDDAFEYYANYENYETAKSFIRAISKYGDKNYYGAIYDEHGVLDKNENKSGKLFSSLFKSIFISMIITVCVVFTILKKDHKMVSIGTSAENYMGNLNLHRNNYMGNLNLHRNDDSFIRHYITKTKLSNNNNSSSGHNSSSGTHSHRSSSGSHHSGGGRHR